MAREITCYVYDKDNTRYVYDYLVTIGTKEGYTKPTVGDLDALQGKLEKKLHKTEAALKRMAHSSPFDLSVEIYERGSVSVGELADDLREQDDQYSADSVRHLR